MKIKEAFKPTVSGKCQTCNFQKVVIIKFRKDVPDASFHSELLQGLTSLKFCWFPHLRIEIISQIPKMRLQEPFTELNFNPRE